MSLIPEFGSNAFVVFPPATKKGEIFFAKNSERPCGEVQEVIYIPGEDFPAGAKVECTYTQIDQVSTTNATFLSKPAWMWGAEMGSNNKGVCIGLTAVKTKLLGKEDTDSKLLGHDLLRLALERADSAKMAADVISSLLEQHGQGGSWQENDKQATYHTNFLIVDRTEAWILETSAKQWVSKRFGDGVHGISPCLTIGSSFDSSSPSLKAQAERLLGSTDGDVNFAQVFGDGASCDRLKGGKAFLDDKAGSVNLHLMMDLLRNPKLGSSKAAAAMVSVLSPEGSSLPCFHLVTATPNPEQSVFKPFVFTNNVNFYPATVSAKQSKEEGDRRHELYNAHDAVRKSGKINEADLRETMRGLEEEVLCFIEEIQSGKEHKEIDLEGLFNDCVETEIKFYI